MLFLYNSGARAHEAAQILISELDIPRSRTCFALALISTPSAPGSGMSLSTRPTFTPKSIWR